MQKAIFIDKDGTLIPDIPYNVDPDLIRISEQAVQGLRSLQQEGYRLIVVSNQSGIARGYFTEADLEKVTVRLGELLGKENIRLDGFYFCPHHPEGSVKSYAYPCDCRKPEPGMLQTAANEQEINLNESWMIGDILNDMEAGKRAGCRTILIDNGNETEWSVYPATRKPDYLVKTINEAAEIIVNAAANKI